MRKTWILLFVLALAGCRHKRAAEENGLASTIHMGNPRAERQLVSGFYGIENAAWRWTARTFAVALRPPAGAKAHGGVLQMRLTVPPPVTEKLGPVTLSASVAGTPLAPETWSAPGDYTYRRDLSAALLQSDSVRIDFQLDKAIAPTAVDQRELGIIILTIALSPK